MHWEDEPYVRVYLRDTVTWRKLDWQARSLLLLLLRKVDRAGCMEVGSDHAEGVALLVEMPLEVAAPALDRLLDVGSVTVRNGTLVMPNFVEAQAAKRTDKARQAEARAKRRDIAKSRIHSDGLSRGVTGQPEPSQPVTPSLALPSSKKETATDPCGAKSVSLPPHLVPNPETPKPEPFDFESLWRSWRNKKKKARAREVFKRRVKSVADFERVKHATECGVREYRNTDAQYVPQYASFLNGYLDDYDEPQTPQARASPTEIESAAAGLERLAAINRAKELEQDRRIREAQECNPGTECTTKSQTA